MPELLSKNHNPEHFQIKHSGGEVLFCLAHGQECAVSIEIDGPYDEDELNSLEKAVTASFEYLGSFTNNKTANIFSGLTVKVGENLAQGGGEAIPDRNLILLNGHKLLISVEEMKSITGTYDEDDLTNLPFDSRQPGSALIYTMVHEMGHILDERTEGNKRHRVSAQHSPTKYGREADQWHTDKDHEAFAEGFAHLVFGLPVDNEIKNVVNQVIEQKLSVD